MVRRRDGVFAGVVAAVVLGLGGCGNEMLVRAMVPVLENTANAARERSDLATVGAGLPANLMLLDGLIRTSPKNSDILGLGAYLYFGYALGFVEMQDPKLASQYYAIGRDYGLRALDHRIAFRNGRAGDLAAFKKGLLALTKKDMPALAWTGANWGRWLSLNLDSAAAIADMPRVEALLDRMLELDPNYQRGLPHALRGAYDALRPELFGGSPARAREHFEAAARISDRKMLLYLVFYAESYCRQVLDEQCFVSLLNEVVAAPDSILPEARLLNEIGRERARKLLDKRAELF